MDDGSIPETRARLLGALIALLVGLIAWLAPIGFGGRMPVGGDVTQFSLGLLAVLAGAIRAGHLPIWNDLWGYGFPGLAESQMGVYYPPHVLLYGLLPLEVAYTASLVGHTLWAGLGAFWAGRRFGVSPHGSALTGYAWAASGFFVIHLPHQWGYTAGSWMPWAWGLAWVLASGRGTRRTLLLLALVLTLQVLSGHFQLAFCTEVGIVLITLAALVEPALRRACARWGGVAVAVAMIAVVPLGAMQLAPTARLAWLAAAQRDYEYLSGFAATPIHLVSYVAPGLFHRSPLWRPVAWDPFRTSPEEHLAYIGLVPLFLAFGALLREFRREPATRVAGFLALATLILSLGPYVPGFHMLIRVPGFSFFRAPARWSLATELALCLLAGRGFDLLPSWPRPGRALVRFVVLAAMPPCLILATIELALLSSLRSEWPWPQLGEAFTIAARFIPGKNPEWPDPDAPRFDAWMIKARVTQDDDPRVHSEMARQGVHGVPSAALCFDRQRWSIYPRELGGTAALMAALLVVATQADRRRFLRSALVALTLVDLWGLSRHRHFDLGPIKPLIDQSPVLARLARAPRGTPTGDPGRNLAMVAGAEPLMAYRTLDLPALRELTSWASQRPTPGLPDYLPIILNALRATGTSLAIIDPVHARANRPREQPDVPGWATRQRIYDPALAGWLNGTDWAARQDPELATFTLWRPTSTAARAWLVPLTAGRSAAMLEAVSEPLAVLSVLASAKPLESRSTRPERLDVTVQADGPAMLIVTQLADPQWQGRWIGPNGRDRPARIVPVFKRRGEHGWQSVAIPGPGAWILHMEYVASDVHAGLLVSGVSFLVLIGLGVFLRPGRHPVKAD